MSSFQYYHHVSNLRKIIPTVSYADIRKGLSPEQAQIIKDVGSVIVSGAVPPEVGKFSLGIQRVYLSPHRKLLNGKHPSEHMLRKTNLESKVFNHPT